MAKELIFKLGGKDFAGSPVKPERKKIYGWTDVVATVGGYDECVKADLSPEDVLIIPSGGLKQATVDAESRWVEKGELTAYSEDGTEELPLLPLGFRCSY